MFLLFLHKLLVLEFISSLVTMGRHKEWRKIAKKMRRKRLRQVAAKARVAKEMEEEEERKKLPGYSARLAEEEIYKLALEDAEKKEHDELQKKWEEEEERVREETLMRQALLKEMAEAKERKRVELEEEAKRKEQAEKEKKERMAEYIYQFSIGEKCGLPAELLIPSESQPGKEICPFFSKVAACRFFEVCTRNHIRPPLSHTIIFRGFYSHFALSKISQAEYDTDMNLEIDDGETYSHFLDFYRDIRTEFEACGQLTHLIVCCNPEPHLRGNVYVSYTLEREAMAAYLKFNGRYYAGKQLSCEFVTIPSWSSAICGLFFKKKCPKGSSCNFLHPFKDPGPPFRKSKHNSPDTWRWSESPERNIGSGESRKMKKRTRERKRSSSRDRNRGSNRSKSPKRRRSRSSERRKSSRSLDNRNKTTPFDKKSSLSSANEHSRSPERKDPTSERRQRRISIERRRQRSSERIVRKQHSERRRSRSSERCINGIQENS